MDYRAPLVLAFVGVLVGLVPACGPLPPCPEVELHPTDASASSAATSCAESLSLGSETYEPWCAPVRAEVLGEVVGRESEVVVQPTFIVRAIRGIPVIAAKAIGRQPRPTALAAGGRCGRWWFAPADRLEPDEAEILSVRVGEGRTADVL